MRVTSKGQVTIPKHLRQRTGMKAGSEVAFSERGGQIVIEKAGRGGRKADDFAAWLERARGTVDLGMTTDEFMDLLRGE